MLKCTKFDFGWGSAPDPAGGSLQRSPGLLLREGEGGSERKGKGKSVCVCVCVRRYCNCLSVCLSRAKETNNSRILQRFPIFYGLFSHKNRPFDCLRFRPRSPTLWQTHELTVPSPWNHFLEAGGSIPRSSCSASSSKFRSSRGSSAAVPTAVACHPRCFVPPRRGL